jgi:hypothetical protein
MILAVVSVAALVLMPAMVSASQFMDITFDGDTVGSAPSTGSGLVFPITAVQAIGGYNTDSLPLSDPGYQNPPTADCGTILVGNVAGMNKAAVMTTVSTNGEMGALWMDTGFGKTSSQLSMKFDISILAAPTSATVQTKYLNGTQDQAGILFGMNTYTSNGWGLRFAAAPTSADGGVFAFRSPDNSRLMTFGNYTEGQKYSLTFVEDYTTGTVDAYIDGALAVSGYKFWNTGVAAPVNTSEFFMFLNGERGYSNGVAIDNIQAFDSAIPEPVTMLGVFLAIGAVAGRVIRGRKNGEIA